MSADEAREFLEMVRASFPSYERLDAACRRAMPRGLSGAQVFPFGDNYIAQLYVRGRGTFSGIGPTRNEARMAALRRLIDRTI